MEPFCETVVRPEKWGDSQVGFRGSTASGGCIVLLPGAFWAHGASKMAILGASLLLCILQCFGASEGMLPPGACRSSCASARRILVAHDFGYPLSRYTCRATRVAADFLASVSRYTP